ncbi:hypothetical protein ACFP2F_18775 [Hymenobacter artigasi]|uniref:Uncharacterized protein n=1 Tax=Hymenobacter artigasi TaxID=2719616 RepID=A0ABX1HP51_9BACT|nr:hypothetical protein [Hymenobacter artigasi]NKI90902.1 hypothetical protein [Hymenobacter artigasi]
MKTTLFLAALLGAGLAALPAPAQQPMPSVPQPPQPGGVQPPRPPQPVVGQPRPPRPPQPQIQPPRPPQPVVVQPQPPRPPQPQIQPPRPPQPVIQPPRPSYSEWLPVITLAVRRPVGQVGAVLDGAYHNFRYLKLRVRNMPLTLDHLLVSYDYGPASSVPLRYRLRPGQDSAPLNLQRLGGRRIRRLDLWYSSSGNLFNPAVVTVLGLR